MMSVAPAVKALIYNETGEFLIIQQILKTREVIWDFPGGRVSYGEDPNETLMREVREEVGLHVKTAEALGMWHFMRNDGIQVVVTMFICTTEDDKVSLKENPEIGENITTFKWVTKEAFLSDSYRVNDQSLKTLIEKHL